MCQLLTKTGKKVIDHTTKLPIYTKPVEMRIKNIAKELGYTKQQLAFELIKSDMRMIGL